MKRFTTLLGLGLLVLTASWVLAPSVAEAVIPERINIQGVLRNASGDSVVVDGSYSVIFTIYDADVGGTAYWTETTSITTTGGLFNYRMGAVNPIPDTAIRLNTWLGIKVGTDPEMTPRPRLVSVSHAYKISTVQGAQGGTISSSVGVAGDVLVGAAGQDDLLYLNGTDPNIALELRSGTFGGNPFIDFANDAVSDYDARIQLLGNAGLRIDVPSTLAIPNGKVGIGTEAPGSAAGLGGTRLEIADGSGGANSDFSLRVSGGGATGSAALNFAKSRGNLSSPTIVQSGDWLGHMLFIGYDGSDFASPAAWIRGVVDGTPGADDMPGRLEFLTTPDGSATPATQMTINNAGNVGIGTISPSSRLHVLQDLDDLSALTIENPNTGTSSQEAILFNSEDGAGLANSAFITVLDGSNPSFPAVMRMGNNRPSGSIDFVTASTRRMIIENGGDVGIGTSDAVNKLDVEGGAAIGATYSGTVSAPANGLLVEGNVGIGLGNPTTRLSVSGQISQSGGAEAAPAYTFVGDLNTGIYNPVANAIGLSTSGLERLRVNSSGDIGIGTTSPSTRLQVVGGQVSIDGGSEALPAIIFGSDANTGIYHPSLDAIGLVTGGSEHLRVTSGGLVGIGTTSPLAKFEVEQSGNTVAGFNRTTNDGNLILLKQDGISEGSITVAGAVVSYNAFTGSHYGWTEETLERGELVSLTGTNRNSHDNPKSEIIYGISRSSVPNDPACLGSYLALSESNQPYCSENPHLVMAVGNGDMWVTDESGDIQPGDYLISSSTPGHAMRDDEIKYPIGHIVARAAEGVDWSTVSEMVGGKKHKKISVLFGNFVRTGIASVNRLLEEQQRQIERLEKKLEAIEGEKPQAKVE